MTEADDIRLAQQGDRAAFETLLNAHYDTIFRFAYKWCGSHADAEDVTQQACIKLARTLTQFRFESAFTTWLYRLVINCAKDWQRSQSRHWSEDDVPAEEFDDRGNPAETNIYLQQVLSILDDMADGFKETALLVHAAGMTHAEAAGVLSIKESTVSWRLHEIRKQLLLLQVPSAGLQEARL
ncbi:MAG TPA: RNA polymerase sigma factor [Cellvibrio sp.]|nr:RNA polymerase sigma factor [Cellvibrio sp.]